ncbi:glutamate--tRNA ligase [Candidatus Pacearchaeota archaeon]|nr:glutamate--tRNA ligase [Candidatus Pacearchaeota archaeon]
MTNDRTISKKIVLAYALENAIKYKGKASQGAVLAGLFAEGLEKSEIKNVIPKIQETLKKVNSMSPEKQQKELEKLNSKTSKRKIRKGLKELPNAEIKKVIMRLAPFPSGPLHIGNARTFILNDEYVKMYDGKLLLIFDDTIGSAQKRIESKSYKLIQEGLDWLGITYEGSPESCPKRTKKIIYKSDRTEKYYKYAEELLKKGYLYVCHCNQEKMQDLKIKGIECSCRELPPESQLKRWKEMFSAKMGSMTVRLKTSMQDPDPAFRDRVMFKISDLPHPKTKTKFRVYPSMDFTWGIDDHVFESTHILRGTDHHLSTRVQNFIREIFKWSNPESIYNGPCEIQGVKISKSKSTQKIQSGEYIGWNDPRTWSLQSLHDRGIKPEAIRQFILSLGIKKTNITTPVKSLYTLNKKLLENVPRYFFVENPIKITIKGCPHLTAKIPRHPNNTLGHKATKTTQDFLVSENDFDLFDNQDYRLMHLLTFKSSKTGLKPYDFSFISEEPKEKIKFLHWLPASPDNIHVEIMMPDGTIKKGLGEYELEKLKIDDIIQFERFGFCRLHKKEKEKLEFWFAHN